MYDVIPDLHADPTRLEATLAKLDGPLVFLGDFIDGKGGKGDDLAVLERVRSLMGQGALAVMGNHELNAILFHRGLRKKSVENVGQHQSFLNAFGDSTPEALAWTDWFLTLPLWLDLGGLRLVHACWSIPDIATIAERRPDGLLQESDLAEIGVDSSEFGRAVKRITSGPEVTLPDPVSFLDGGKKKRHEVRLAWWRSDALTWREAALSVPEAELTKLPDAPLPDDLQSTNYPQDAPPVLVGHYKMKGDPMAEGGAASIDYPHSACAYRWRGETVLTSDNLVTI